MKIDKWFFFFHVFYYYRKHGRLILVNEKLYNCIYSCVNNNMYDVFYVYWRNL